MKNINVKEFRELLFYCDYSKPIINILKENIEDKEKKSFFQNLIRIWNFESGDFIYYQNKEKDMISMISLREIIRFFRIKRLIDFKYYNTAKKEINILKRNLSHLPAYIREIIIPTIVFISIESYEKTLIRKYNKKAYSNDFLELLYLKILLEKNKGKKYYNELDNILSKMYEYSLELKHPHLICKTLEDTIKVFKEKDKIKVYYAYKLLQYYTGYYFDDFFRITKWLSLTFENQLLNNDISIFFTAQILFEYNKNHKLENKKIRKYLPNLKAKKYILDKGLKDFISKKTGEKIKSKFINSKKVKELINNNNVKYLSKKPYAIKNELYKIQIKDIFNINIKKSKKMKKNMIISNFIATVISYVNKPRFLKKSLLSLILIGNKANIIKYFSGSHDKMLFFNIMISENIINCDSPFILGRKKILLNILKDLKNVKDFIYTYFNLKIYRKYKFDIFLRNSARYNGVVGKEYLHYGQNEVLIRISKKYNIELDNLIFGYYSFDFRERILLNEILEKF
ncbi:hypothetical protein [Marinitoga aeolica]|uniref:Uncharacterized protein n=1 Tax=Marinitoga aeolica TaxID=2809031 RepID=A0ABY8PP67_9BACT|nr:hypothetical protein [Marinitoga aeolica]WGS64423.1 hypothetical protein JRV97_08575 [Marinitoga aeolica]